jgi:hypothetical protein
VHNYMRTHGSEGATEPGRGEPWPVGPGRPAQPTSVAGSAPLSLHPKVFNPKVLEAPPFDRERVIRTRRRSTS